MDQFPQIVAVYVLRSGGLHLNLSHRDENLGGEMWLESYFGVSKAVGQVSSKLPRAD